MGGSAPVGTRRGTIKRVFPDKGYGFIRGSDGVAYFFHRSTCEGVRIDALIEHQAVEFEAGADSGKGPRATRVWAV